MRDAMTQPATPRQIAAFAEKRGISTAEAAALLYEMRTRQITRRAEDPFSYGYEPPIWYVVKALLRNPVWSDYERTFIRKRLGAEWTVD